MSRNRDPHETHLRSRHQPDGTPFELPADPNGNRQERRRAARAQRPTLDQQLSDGLADGRITDVDVEEVQRFREFLRQCKLRGRAVVAADPAWAAYIRGEEETDG